MSCNLRPTDVHPDHQQYLLDEVAVDQVTFLNLTDTIRVRLTLWESHRTGTVRCRIETQSLEIPDRTTWPLQTDVHLDLS